MRKKIMINANKIIKVNDNFPKKNLLINISEGGSTKNTQKGYSSSSDEILKLENTHRRMKGKNEATLVNSKPGDNYIILGKLGKGSFGKVYKVKHKITGEIRAMKIINNKSIINNNQEIDNKVKEIQVLKELDHPNIVKIIEYYIDNEKTYIITELLNGEDLYKTLVNFKKFSEKKAAFIMKQILSALSYLHSKGIVHGDIKPGNIFVHQMSDEKNKNEDTEFFQIKLIDFGASNFLKKDEKLSTKVGSPYYIAPEILNSSYNEKCDIWSSGVVLYIMLTGKYPFIGNTLHNLIENIKTGKYRKFIKEYKAISKEGKKLLEQMLTLNPIKRISASQCLNSPFFINYDNIREMPNLLPSVFTNIYKLNVREKLHQAVINIIVHNLENNEELGELKEIFEFLDINKDGFLNINEIQKAFKRIFPEYYINDEKMKIILKKMDGNSDGFISYEEFLRTAINEKIILEKTNLKLAFDAIDINKDGKLSKDELINAIGFGTSDYVNNLLKLIGKKREEFISFEDFCTLMRKGNYENH